MQRILCLYYLIVVHLFCVFIFCVQILCFYFVLISISTFQMYFSCSHFICIFCTCIAYWVCEFTWYLYILICHTLNSNLIFTIALQTNIFSMCIWVTSYLLFLKFVKYIQKYYLIYFCVFFPKCFFICLFLYFKIVILIIFDIFLDLFFVVFYVGSFCFIDICFWHLVFSYFSLMFLNVELSILFYIFL